MIVVICFLLLIIILLCLRCCHCKGTSPSVKVYPSQLIIYKNPDSPQTSFSSWLDRFKDTLRGYGEIIDSSFCPNCDSDLVLLSGPGPQLYIQQSGSGGSGGGSLGGPGGGDGPAFYCANVEVSDPYLSSAAIHLDSLFNFNYITRAFLSNPPSSLVNPPLLPNTTTRNAITVAVFDTGEDTIAAIRSYVTGVARSCLVDPASRYGWNFVAGNANTFDDHPEHHGSNVTRFIINQALWYQSNEVNIAGGPVNILPVKIFDASGKGSLYNILCGIAYVANSGVKMINASFGFYECTDTVNNKAAAGLLNQYMLHYLVSKHILMVAAAGNANRTADSIYRAEKGNQQANPRDLDSNHFYPACLVKDTFLQNNLLVVTTVSADDHNVSPLQNFSSTIVDVGVNCDTVIDSSQTFYYCFADPAATLTLAGATGAVPGTIIHTVTGSSFATPIITGKIASYYDKLVGNGMINKDTILARMQSVYPRARIPLLRLDPTGKLNKMVNNGRQSVKRE
jgi:hypothetical protein